MSINFPTSLDTLANPTAGELLENAVAGLDHDKQHSNANDAIEALEAKVGVNSSAVTTSHDYKLGEVTSGDKAVGKTATQTLTNKTLTSPILNLSSNATGDMYYRKADGTLERLPIGSTGNILDVSAGGVPEWVANPSGSDASTSQKGVVKLSVAPVSSTNPIAVGDNDPRLGGGVSEQDIPFYSGTNTSRPSTINTTSTQDGGILYTAEVDGAGNINIIRYLKDTISKQYYITHTTSYSGFTITTVGLCATSTYLYVSFVDTSGPTTYLKRYSLDDLSGVTDITFSGTAKSGKCFSNGTDIYISGGANTFTKFTISGTTATNGGDITFTSAGTVTGCIANSTNAWVTDNTTIRKYALAGGAVVSSMTLNSINTTYPNPSSHSLFLQSNIILGICFGHTIQSASAVIGSAIKLNARTLF